MVPLKSGLQKSRVVEFYSICFRNLQQICFPWVSSSFLQIRSQDLFESCKFSRLILKFQPNQMCVCSECLFVYLYFYLCHRKLKMFAWITSWIEFVPLNLPLWLTTVFLAPYFYSWKSKRICLVLFHLQISFMCLNFVVLTRYRVLILALCRWRNWNPETYWLAPKLKNKQWTLSIPKLTHWSHSYNFMVVCYCHFPSGNERVQN